MAEYVKLTVESENGENDTTDDHGSNNTRTVPSVLATAPC